MKIYVDSSVVLRIILKQADAFPESWLTGSVSVVASELLHLETVRTLDRLRVRGILTEEKWLERTNALAEIVKAFEKIPLDPSILIRAAASLPVPLGALDAIHLASALIWTEQRGEPLVFLTHDTELATAARAFALVVKTAP